MPNTTGLAHGPYADASTTRAADLAVETIRYLTLATAEGGITDPATIAAVTASLTTTAHRLPQLLNTISAWLVAGTVAGRIADDHQGSSDQLADRIRAASAHAADAADDLTVALAAVYNLSATLHAAEPTAVAR